jgi:hypothetical protein
MSPTVLGSLIGPALSKGSNRVGTSLPSLRTETDPVSETLCFLAVQNSGRWTSRVMTIVYNTIVRTLYFQLNKGPYPQLHE